MTSDISTPTNTDMDVDTGAVTVAAKVTLWVCITCRISLTHGIATMSTDGRDLFNLISLRHDTYPAAKQISLQPVECMGSCERACTAGIGAPGKFSYLFGSLEPTPEHAAAMLDCALLLGQQRGAVLGRIHRPALLRNSLLSRIPPLTLSNPRSNTP
ncbi:MAG: DUF1636 family protein [Acidobacteriaceae bacterium]